jgi:formylglycine-generating enzyme required for sulfatase activity
MQLLERLQQIQRKLLIAIGVLFLVLIVLVAAAAVAAFFLLRSDSRLTAQIKKNRIGMEFVPVAAGSFMMGSETGRNDERPAHKVTIGLGFLMGRNEVTAGEWKAVMGREPYNFKGDRFPAQFITWNQTQEFIRRLNQMNDGYSYRLPTEAEWEYACRAGTTGEFADELNWIAWYDANSEDQVHVVGSLHPNAWGINDMEGNLWEYCEDWYKENYYSQSPGTDPQGPASGAERVQRGGSYSDRGPRSNYDHSSYLRSAARKGTGPDTLLDNNGFRIVAITH